VTLNAARSVTHKMREGQWYSNDQNTRRCLHRYGIGSVGNAGGCGGSTPSSCLQTFIFEWKSAL